MMISVFIRDTTKHLLYNLVQTLIVGSLLCFSYVYKTAKMKTQINICFKFANKW